MKDKIKLAGYKSQAEFAREMDICTRIVSVWNKIPEQCPKVYGEYLNLSIRYDMLEEENKELRGALKTFKRL